MVVHLNSPMSIKLMKIYFSSEKRVEQEERIAEKQIQQDLRLEKQIQERNRLNPRSLDKAIQQDLSKKDEARIWKKERIEHIKLRTAAVRQAIDKIHLENQKDHEENANINENQTLDRNRPGFASMDPD